ncbi:zinc finger and BTB domain-containing protein 17 isoform X1 [Drosophila elegans]|uniref:zinc finger and BTB domain-containing protein 17 isoform X1 n=1 Tax=Drosophila elegans TaxID=30023 RepID=UPI0007E7E2FE|nr:zinc finger and BTB domain-containing protein 17 isoform X1 [Drosophila elegans]
MDAPASYPDLATLCRLCLKEHQDAYAIFEEDDSQLSIPVRLMACVALDAKAADSLPKRICQECRYQLEKSFLFRQRCQASEKKLRKHIRLLGLGKRSRVFSKDPDDYDEDELEFEDSIAFIERQDKVRKLQDDKWREEFKEEQAAEFNKRLVKSRLELRAKLTTEIRKGLAEEVRSEVRDELAEEVRSQVREELRHEVSEDMRKEQLAMLLGELEVYLAEKKAGQWEPLEGSEVDSKAQVKEDSSPSRLKLKLPPKRRLSSTSKPQASQRMKEEKNEEFILECNSEPLAANEVNIDTLELEEVVPTEGGNDFGDMVDTVRTEDGDIYIINSNSSEDQKPGSAPEFDQDDGITSYNIKEDGEIQFSGEKTEEIEDVVVFNLNAEISEEQQVFNFDENVIIVEKEPNKGDEQLPAKCKRSSDFVFKQVSDCPQPKAGRVTDTVKSFQCHLCPVAFATQKLLTRHHNTHIKGLKSGKGGTLKCPSCSLQLSCASSLKRHMIIHTGLKPYKCSECDSSFSQREVLKRHMDIHTGAKRHQCPQCSSCFAQKSNLQQHIGRVHMGNSRTHKCHLCQRSFNHVSGLSRHLVTHAGVMFSCKQCGRQFNDRSAVQRHVTTMHKVKSKSADYISEPEISETEFQAV